MAKKILALLAALALLLAFASCGKAEDPTEAPTTTVEETEEVFLTTEPDTSETEEDTAEGTTDAVGVETTTAEEVSSKESETATTAETTTKPAGKPGTKEEIVAYFNDAYKKVKTEKPGYTFHERTDIDKNKIKSSKSWLESVASLVMPIAESAFTKWSDPEVTAKGADHSGLPPYVDVDPKWLKSATCTENGGNYVIRLNLVDENVPVLPKDSRTTIHGKMLDRGVYNWDAVIGGTEQIPVIKIEINTFACNYSGSYLDATINKTTGALVKVTTWTFCQAQVEVKVPIFGVLDASVPLGNESEYYDFGK